MLQGVKFHIARLYLLSKMVYRSSGGSRNFQRGFQIPLNFSLTVSRRPKKRSQPAVERYSCDFKI